MIKAPQGESFEGPQAADMQSRHSTAISAFEGLARTMGSDSVPILIFGYSANYAAFVHENVDAKFNRPGAHARWLYKAIQDKKAEMLEEIRKHARIK